MSDTIVAAPAWPTRRTLPWLPAGTPTEKRYALAARAHMDIGLCETNGKNRGKRIDEYMQAVGSPVGLSWCAAAMAAWARECGLPTPKAEAGSTDVWMRWAMPKRWIPNTGTYVPKVGDVVIYGVRNPLVNHPVSGNLDAQHIGVIVRADVSPKVFLTVEGNTSPTPGDKDGIGVFMKYLNWNWALGFIDLEAA